MKERVIAQSEKYLKYDDEVLKNLNQTFKNFDFDTDAEINLGVLCLGRQAPGGNNIVDGLLRYQKLRKNVKLYGFINGMKGLMD